MVDDMLEAVAKAIYMTHWREGCPIWDNASENVKQWVRKQAEAAIVTLHPIIDEAD